MLEKQLDRNIQYLTPLTSILATVPASKVRKDNELRAIYNELRHIFEKEEDASTRKEGGHLQ